MGLFTKIRSVLYGTAKTLGDVEAVVSCDPKKIKKRIVRRVAGKQASKVINKLASWI